MMDDGGMSTFDNQSMSIGCIGKLGHFFGFLRHYLLMSGVTTSDMHVYAIGNDSIISFLYL